MDNSTVNGGGGGGEWGAIAGSLHCINSTG